MDTLTLADEENLAVIFISALIKWHAVAQFPGAGKNAFPHSVLPLSAVHDRLQEYENAAGL
ncbi:hypothetical protein [Erwinia sp. V71]|uniref:hypothetical protein n=1 Tax=Erwinia sp. V71 TaxID=3369424 RepID=UPI003F5DEB70